MAAMDKGARGITKANRVSGSIGMHYCDNCPTLDVMESMVKRPECQSCGNPDGILLIFPRPRNLSAGSSRHTRNLMPVLIEVAVYLAVASITLYSVAVSSLPVLMSAMIIAALYIVLSHFYEVAAKSRQKVAEENYLRLVTSSFSRN